MIHSEKEIIYEINNSGNLGRIDAISISDMTQQGILGNLYKIELRRSNQLSKKCDVIYKNQCCSDKLRESIVYDLLSESFKDLIPQKICDFQNGDIVIENLKNCKSGKIIDGCNISDAKNILSGIAKIHSFFWDQSKIPVDSYNQFAGILKYNLDENWESYIKRYSLLLGNAEKDFKWLLNNSKTASLILHEGKTLTHGDLHLENIMFSESEKIYFIDWQLASKRSPAFDISFFLIQNVDSEIRKKHENELLEHYYNNLPANIKSDYSFRIFILEYRACLTRSMMSSVMMIGKRFAHKENQMDDADIIANRVIHAVKELKPIEAIEELIRLNKHYF